LAATSGRRTPGTRLACSLESVILSGGAGTTGAGAEESFPSNRRKNQFFMAGCYHPTLSESHPKNGFLSFKSST
jgi:hypothetical protein